MKSHIKIKSICFAILSTLTISSVQATTSQQSYSFKDFKDFKLRYLLKHNKVNPVTPPAKQDEDLVELGRNLFFEKEIAGTRNISCATCHSPLLGSADGQGQSRGQGAIGLGPHRRGEGNFFQFLPRNTLSLWNRGVEEWDTMFWDGRLGGTLEEGYFSPADPHTPQTFTNSLAAFSIIPLTPDEEMRGFPGQPDAFGNPNEMADLTNDDFTLIWPLVTARMTNHDGYNELLANAFPDLSESELDITHVAEAIGAFMSEAFTALNSPFDRYLAGENNALSDSQKRGAILFYGPANCASCHSGGLQTDLDFYNIAAPQVGTGRGDAAPLDLGRGAITGNADDDFKFRTPSLRNIELESPYFHNGAFTKLEDAVRHHINPAQSLADYDSSQLEPELVGLFQNDDQTINALLDTVSPRLQPSRRLYNSDVKDIMAFLSALTDPASLNMLDIVPDELPSGLTLSD